MSRFEIVRTNAGHHARFIADNGKTVWTTEVYKRRTGAVNAIASIGDAPRYSNGRDADLIEVRDVDDRYVPPPVELEPPFFHTTTNRILNIGTRQARYGPTEDFWHDREYHYRNCDGTTDQGGNCTEAVPPAGAEVQGRMGKRALTAAESAANPPSAAGTSGEAVAE